MAVPEWMALSLSPSVLMLSPRKSQLRPFARNCVAREVMPGRVADRLRPRRVYEDINATTGPKKPVKQRYVARRALHPPPLPPASPSRGCTEVLSSWFSFSFDSPISPHALVVSPSRAARARYFLGTYDRPRVVLFCLAAWAGSGNSEAISARRLPLFPVPFLSPDLYRRIPRIRTLIRLFLVGEKYEILR